jgi:ABC-type proline/glycine betaine transport system ATPase subunit
LFAELASGVRNVDSIYIRAAKNLGAKRLAMVFQEYALFPWMTVYRNVAFGLELAGMGRSEIRDTVNLWLHKLQLWDFRDRFPKDLSRSVIAVDSVGVFLLLPDTTKIAVARSPRYSLSR